MTDTAEPLPNPQPAPGRSCGDCGMCCKVLAIEALEKPAGAWCSHFRKGCGIYADRPRVCRGFMCLWISNDRLDEAWRPNRAGFLMYAEPDGRRLNVVVDSAKPLAWRQAPYYERLKAMSRRALDGYELLVSIGDRRIVVFPDQDIDLGAVNPEHKIVSGYATVEGERVPFAMVLSDLDTPEAASASPARVGM